MNKVIDVHVHIGSSGALYVAGGNDAVVSRMEKWGISHSVVSPIPGFEDPYGIESVKSMNRQAVQIREEYKDKFPLVLGVAEPRHGPKAAVEEAACALGELGMNGLMFHHDFAGVENYAPVMFDILDEVMRYPKARIVQMHTAQHSMLEPPFGMWIIAERYPEIKFLCGHPMMSMIQLDNMAEIMKHCPNVFVDTCCTWTHDSAINVLADKMGSVDQIMFGSDNPYWHPNICMDKLLLEQARLSEEDRQKIFSGNFEREFGKAGGDQ